MGRRGVPIAAMSTISHHSYAVAHRGSSQIYEDDETEVHYDDDNIADMPSARARVCCV